MLSGIQPFEEFPGVFRADGGVGLCNNDVARIKVDPSVKPVAQRLRRTNIHQREKLAAEILRLEKMDIIERLQPGDNSEWMSNTLIVSKKDGSVRMTLDSKILDTAVERSRYCFPSVEDIRYALLNATNISKIDLNKAYHQIIY